VVEIELATVALFREMNLVHRQYSKLNSKGKQFVMKNHTIGNHTDLRSCFAKLSMEKNMGRFRVRGLNFVVAILMMILASTASAQKSKSKPTLVVGSEVNLAAVTGADWIQGEGPAAFEPEKIYVFECWATWCGPCIELIPHVNELHKKYYDQGLRVHGMSWDEGREEVEKFVKAKGEGMSYPVAFTGEGSAFESEWLNAAGVKSIPHAFIVKNGKLLFATEAVRLTDSLVELMLSGDEGAEKAAAKIKAAYDSYERTEELSQEFFLAKRSKNADKMVALIDEIESLDPDHPELSVRKLEVLVVREEWAAAIAAFNEMPASSSKNSFLMNAAMRIANSDVDEYSMDFTKAVTFPYAEYIARKGKAIGPNHFAFQSILFWRIGDKQTAIAMAEKGVEVAKNFSRATEIRTNAFKRFEKLVKEGTMPAFSDLTSWQVKARRDAEAAKKKAPQATE
jgi:thiol-disulfide isomerase/thioredoxin